MSENNEHRLENAEIEAENNQEQKEQPKKQAAPKARKRKRRRSRIGVGFAALLVAISMVFGLIVGYAVGVATATARLSAAEKGIVEQVDAAMEVGRQDVDVFTDSLSAENRAALADLSGMSMENSDENVFLGLEQEDGFTGLDESALQEDVVVAEFNGGQLTSAEVSREYTERLTDYIFAGYTEEEIASKLLDEVMKDLVTEKLLYAQAEKLGVAELSEADVRQIDEQAQAQLAESAAAYESFVYEDGMSDAEVSAAAQSFMEQAEGVTYASIRAEIEENWWREKLRSEIVKDVQISSSDILATYNALLDEQKESFSADPASFEAAQQRGDLIVYRLAGYRAVKPLLIRMDEGFLGEANELRSAQQLLGANGDADQLAEIQARLDECYAAAESEAQGLLDRLNAGEDFDSLLAQYGDDAGMKKVELRATGYYVKADSASLDSAIVAAAMQMGSAGEISGLIRTEDGVCILQFVGEVSGGEVDMASVYDAISARTRASAQDIAYDAQLAEWLEAADVKYYPELMQ